MSLIVLTYFATRYMRNDMFFNIKLQSEETMAKRNIKKTFDICDLLKNNIFETITTKILRKKAKETTKEKHCLQEWESVEQSLWNSY